jgi:1,4-dihydroxy-2-naphthoyl-CoA hydrolase
MSESITSRDSHYQNVLDALGITVEMLSADETICTLTIDNRHLQPIGVVHGGIYVLLAETAASIAGTCALTKPHNYVVGLEINANHLGASSEGVLRASAKSLHCGRSTMVYEIRVTNQERLVSIARTTLMVKSA